MAEDKLGRNQLDKLLAEHPALKLQTTFDCKDRAHTAKLRLDLGQDPAVLRQGASLNVSLEAVAAVATLLAVATALSLNSLVAWILPLVVGAGLSALIARQVGLRKRADASRQLHEKYENWEFVHPVQRSWRVATESDETIAWLVTQWMLTSLEIEQLEQRIREGVVARKHLPPVDPLRTQMQVEIDTLRSRRDDLRASAQIEAQRISEHSQEHSEAKKREALKQQRLTAIAESEAASARDLDEKIRAAEQAEQERLAKQERAQKWLYDTPDR